MAHLQGRPGQHGDGSVDQQVLQRNLQRHRSQPCADVRFVCLPGHRSGPAILAACSRFCHPGKHGCNLCCDLEEHVTFSSRPPGKDSSLPSMQSSEASDAVSFCHCRRSWGKGQVWSWTGRRSCLPEQRQRARTPRYPPRPPPCSPGQ